MKIKALLFLVLLTASISGCKVTLLPNYNEDISNQIETTLKTVDKFYLTMLETTKNQAGQRSYANFINSYIDIEVELQSLLDKNKVRPLNKNSIAICENTLKQFQKYKDKHKADNKISDENIILNRLYMHDQLMLMQMGEAFKPVQ